MSPELEPEHHVDQPCIAPLAWHTYLAWGWGAETASRSLPVPIALGEFRRFGEKDSFFPPREGTVFRKFRV